MRSRKFTRSHTWLTKQPNWTATAPGSLIVAFRFYVRQYLRLGSLSCAVRLYAWVLDSVLCCGHALHLIWLDASIKREGRAQNTTLYIRSVSAAAGFCWQGVSSMKHGNSMLLLAALLSDALSRELWCIIRLMESLLIGLQTVTILNGGKSSSGLPSSGDKAGAPQRYQVCHSRLQLVCKQAHSRAGTAAHQQMSILAV